MIYKYYDFIVIGAGSAGAVVANRLSEQPDWNVLLLEAGGDETETSDVPALAAYLQLSELDWQYKTEPQPTACLAFNDKRYKNETKQQQINQLDILLLLTTDYVTHLNRSSFILKSLDNRFLQKNFQSVNSRPCPNVCTTGLISNQSTNL